MTFDSNPPTKKRRPALAALLSLLVMGLGQLYNGRFRRAAFLFSIDILAVLLFATSGTLLFSFHGVIGMYIAVLVLLSVRLLAVIDAFIGARRAGQTRLKRYQRWYVYIAVFVAANIVTAFAESPVANFSIPAGSMIPTLLVVDYVASNKNAYRDHEPERGDIIIFKLPLDNQTDYIKRLIGLVVRMCLQCSAGKS